jgi:hypothetical protein
MHHAADIYVEARDLAAIIDPVDKGESGAWEFDGGEGPIVQQKAMVRATIDIIVLAHDLAAIVDPGDSGEAFPLFKPLRSSINRSLFAD